MTDTAIYERDVIVPQPAELGGTPFSWSAAIAGALAATAVAFLIVALGSGIGLSFASPFGSGPSATTLTVAAAVWLVMAQSMGFATGGYLAGRLRSPASDGVVGETTFRDAAQGFVVWALGVVAMIALAAGIGLLAARATSHVTATDATAGTGARDAASASALNPVDYYVDLMFRPRSSADVANGRNASPTETMGAAAAPVQQLSPEMRAEVKRIVMRATAEGRLDPGDRAYLAQVVSARTGLPSDQAERRVGEVEGKARADAKETADKVAKAGAMFSFWTFMSLLFGAAAATLAGMLGGQLRDAEAGAAG
jgi:hypothetical protein